jgi:hypothetical protein
MKAMSCDLMRTALKAVWGVRHLGDTGVFHRVNKAQIFNLGLLEFSFAISCTFQCMNS